MTSADREPSRIAGDLEDHPRLPSGGDERVSGYGVLGLTFTSGHVLGLRRWTASSVGEGFTSIWHRDPAGTWTFYESTRSEIACSRYFGADVQREVSTQIALDWTDPRRLRITAANGVVDWTIGLGSTATTRAMNAFGSALPLSAWRSRLLLAVMGKVSGKVLGVGTVRLSGCTSNGQHFDANPLRIWRVSDSRATVEGLDLGPVGPLPEQAHLADFYIPQRGIFAAGRMFITQPAARERV